MTQFPYDIAFSFAGEDREYVEQVAKLLKQSGVNVFYDLFEESNLWGKNLYDYLSDIYENKARYVVIFISKEYATKLWTNHERQAAQARAFKEKSEYILPSRFDNTEIPGIKETVGYISLKDKTPIQFASLIIQKIGFKLKTLETPKNLDLFKVKISTEDFLKVITKLYGTISNLKFDWYSIYWDINDTYNTQLEAIYRRGKTASGVDYEVNLWDFWEHEQRVKELEIIESELKIAIEMEAFTKHKLPLTDICVKKEDLIGENELPGSSAAIWLMYGEHI